MKTIQRIVLLIGSLIISFSATACKKSKSCIIIKDCTGSYIRIEDSDYLICNNQMVNDYESNTKVTVLYKTVEKCPPTNTIRCRMYHKNEGCVKLFKVK